MSAAALHYTSVKTFLIKGFTSNRPEMTGLCLQVEFMTLNQIIVLYIKCGFKIFFTSIGHFEIHAHRVNMALITA